MLRLRPPCALALPAALLVLTACDGPTTPAPDPLAVALDSVMAAHAPGAGRGVAAAVALGDAFLWTRGHGQVATGSDAVTPATVFQVASLTMQFTAAIILRLEEAGRLALDDHLATHLSDSPPQWRDVRIRHLLEHTAGLPDYMDRVTPDPGVSLTRADILDTIAAYAFHFEPGGGWRFGNSGYYLLGLVIEAVTGDDYADHLRHEILLPLDLHHTSLCGSPPNETPPSGREGLQIVPPVNMDVPWSAGALCSTAPDLVRWARALARGDVISADSYARMTTPARLDDGRTVAYGLGLLLGLRDGHVVHHHSGASPGFRSQLSYYPERDLAVAVLINQAPAFPDGFQRRLADQALADGRP